MTLLRYFPAYRAMEREIQDLASQVILAEDQARLWRARSDAAEEREQKAIEAKDVALKMMSNAGFLYAGMRTVPFPDVYMPMPEPVSTEEEAPEPRKRRASELVKDMEREFAAEYGAYVDRQMAE